jgi:creatinine amidohydrolase
MLRLWYETISEDFDFERAVGVMCVASCEQHSSYLPVGVDGFIGETLCVEAARVAKSDVFLLPTQKIGFSPHHRAFKGYITLSQETMFRYMTEICLCVFENGLNKLLLVNSHGGNQSCLQTVVNELGSVYKKRVVLVRYWDLISDFVANSRKSANGGMGHAGELETSLMIYMFPELVDRSRIFETPPTTSGNRYHMPDMFAKNSIYLYKDFSEYSDRGNIGQAHYADPKFGRLIAEQAISALAELIDYYAVNEF